MRSSFFSLTTKSCRFYSTQNLPSVLSGLKDPKLLKTQGYINGKWVSGKSTYEVNDPATDKPLVSVADLTLEDTQQAISAAVAAFPQWSQLPAKERGKKLRRWFDLQTEHTEDLARILTAENGKPLSEASGEISYGSSFVEWFAEEAKRAYGQVIPNTVHGKRLMVIKQAVGVCSIITPWNFPNAMITRKLGAALAAGCTVVARPAEETPLSALALAELAERAGIPPGVINIVVSTNAAGVGEVLSTSADIAKLSFTGSTAVGKLLMKQASSTLKRLSLELGGNAPLVVFADADVEVAVRGTLASKFRNSGQTCVCPNRLFVHRDIADKFLQRLVEEVKKLKVGNGFERGVQIGPLINRRALEKVTKHVEDAKKRGAEILYGGKALPELGPLFYQPTVLSNLNSEMLISCEETFGPIVAFDTFQDEEEVLKRCNDVNVGLAGYFFTKDLARAWRFAEALEVGMVGINEGILSAEVSPFGGVKESGFGREGSMYGLQEYLHTKYLCFGNLG